MMLSEICNYYLVQYKLSYNYFLGKTNREIATSGFQPSSQ